MKKQGTEDLWRACFNDTDEFIRLYFDNVYQDENSLAIEKHGRIVSALQLLPYTMQIKGNIFPFAYISGVCTHPGYRGQGLMGELMSEAENVLRQRNVPLAALIPAEPWLFGVYRKYGYTEAFFYTEEIFIPAEHPVCNNVYISIAEVKAQGLFPYFDRKMRERPVGVLHSEEDFAVIRKDLEISRGKFLVAKDRRGEVTGMAFTAPGENDGEAFIPELLCDSDLLKDILLYSAAELYNATKVINTTSPTDRNGKAKGMAKIIDKDYFRNAGIDTDTIFIQKNARMTLMLD